MSLNNPVTLGKSLVLGDLIFSCEMGSVMLTLSDVKIRNNRLSIKPVFGVSRYSVNGYYVMVIKLNIKKHLKAFYIFAFIFVFYLVIVIL